MVGLLIAFAFVNGFGPAADLLKLEHLVYEVVARIAAVPDCNVRFRSVTAFSEYCWASRKHCRNPVSDLKFILYMLMFRK